MSEKNEKIEKTEKKPVKVKEEKPTLSARIGRWFREMRSELKKVVWPTRKQLINNTLIVIVAVVIVSAVIGLMDLVFLYALDWLRETVS